VDIVMPQMGESVAEGTVTLWLKATGDAVEKDEPLLEIQSDKVDAVIDSPATGTLARIIVEAGETVSVGVVLGRLVTEASPNAPDGSDASPPIEEPDAAHFGRGARPHVVSFAPRAPDPVVSSTDRRYSPAVVAAAARNGIEADQLSSITATGRGGRLTLDDVTRAIESAHVPASATTPRGPQEPPGASTSMPPSEYLYQPTDRDEVMAMSPTRRRIAAHMSWSRRISAHATAFDEVEVGALARWLADAKQSSVATGSTPVTWTAAIAHAAVVCLGDFPALNAAVVGDQIVYRPYVNLSIAVAVGDGLVAPVIADAHLADSRSLAARVADVTARARARQLDNSEVRGGTFTYSNPGIAGGLFGTPILNQPQVALLSTNAVRDRPWVVEGNVVARPVLGMSLSFDHRLVDGLMAFQFIESLRSLLSDPERLSAARSSATKAQRTPHS
jgi:pyruvate/2-oxoglutarate dehydrogenase complex dihydrolipoamide acyltransferase (E2) component